MNNYINNPNQSYGRDGRNKNTPWRVICDRTNNNSYVTPNAKSEVKDNLEYLGSYYVTEANEEWIHIVRVEGGGFVGLLPDKNARRADMGWVQRNKMLLWQEGLLDVNSRISLKCILLNKTKDIRNIISLKQREAVDVFDGPGIEAKRLGSRNIYNIFYVLKKENNRLLLADRYELSDDASTSIIGWISESRLSKWNTRVAIEPNFDAEAFNERKEHEDNRFAFFENTSDASAYANRTSGAASRAIFNNDPVILAPEKLSKKNPQRYIGKVIRYPILENMKDEGLFRTGVIGSIPTLNREGKESSINENDLARAKENLAIAREEDKNVNVYFMIEGGTEMNAYKTKITELIFNLPRYFPNANNINVGCAIYRDLDLGDPTILPFEAKSLSQNRNTVIDFINNASFYQPADADAYTIFRYAFKQVVKDKWEAKQRNILVIIGNGADIYKNTNRRIQEESKKPEYYIDGDKMGSIYDQLAALDMNVLFFQPKNAEGNEFKRLRSDVREIMGETSMQLYNGVMESYPKYSGQQPLIPDFIGGKFLEAKYANYSGIYTALAGSAVPEDKLGKELVGGFQKLNEFKDSFFDILDKIFIKGESIDVAPGEYQQAILGFIHKNSKGIDPTALNQFLNEKFQLFQEAWLPKKVVGYKYPLYSYILFAPKRELEIFIEKLKPLGSANRSGSMTEKRRVLKNAMLTLVLELSNQKSTSSAENLDMGEVMKIITGLNTEGVVVFEKLSANKLKDLEKRSAFSDEEINSLVSNMIKMQEKLDGIVKLGTRYEFHFRHEGDNENIYFWIALNEILDNDILQ